VHIRDARPEEAGALTELQRRASLVWDETREALLAHPEVIDVPVELLASVRVAEDEGHPVGFSAVIPLADGAAELDGLFVEPDLMRGGVGRALVDDAIGRLRATGVTRLEVTANLNALGFYERVGFIAVGPVETQFSPALRMYRPV
jgi:GNAT superfamily N-acetyltransferase